MKAKILKAMQRCCSQEGATFPRVYWREGEVCALDMVVAVRYSSAETREVEPAQFWQLPEDALSRVRPSEEVRLVEGGYLMPYGQTVGQDFGNTPGLRDTWKTLAGKADPKAKWPELLSTDPAHLMRVLKVYEAVGALPIIRNDGRALWLEGWNPKTREQVYALVMGCR